MSEVDASIRRRAAFPPGGWRLLQLLKVAGWELELTPAVTRNAFAGQGIRIRIFRDDREPIVREGASVADIAPGLFQDAMRDHGR